MTQRASRIPPAAAPMKLLWFRWLTFMAPLAALGALTFPSGGLANLFYWEQDILVAAVMTGLLLLLPFAPGPTGVTSEIRSGQALFAIAAVVVLLAYAGTWLVMENYPLSMDEFMAHFDARIFRTGRPLAPVPAPWRPYVPQLQPIFLLPVPGNGFWASAYLPVNAAFRGLGAVVGLEEAVNPIWAGLSILALYGVARRLWPDRPRTALVAVVLLGTSAQFLFMAMTAYAMPAHLALNLIWLWLVLKGGWRGHGLAALVAFLACGLHQLAFNLLFAAPFVLQMWFERRWRPALWHTAVYGAIALFWISYWALIFKFHGVHPPKVIASSGSLEGFLTQVFILAFGFNRNAFEIMAQNLVRFATWQSLLTVPLLLYVARSTLRTPGPLRSMLLGIVLMLLVALVLIPIQGHGWGYRYLHGFLGSACLLAANGWDRLQADAGEGGPKTAQRIFALGAVASVLLLPLRAWQANTFLHPYAAAERAVQSSPAEVVLVDRQGVLVGADLVRNDPWLRTRPKVLLLNSLDRDQVSRLCATHTVEVFSSVRSLSFGVRPLTAAWGAMEAHPPKARALSTSQVCGR